MANNTGLIIGVSFIGVVAIGASIYFITKKKDVTTQLANNMPPRTGYNIPYPPNPNIGSGNAQVNNNNNNNDWWKGIASSVGSNLGNKLVDSIFNKPKNKTNSNTWSNNDSDAFSDDDWDNLNIF